MRFFKSKQRIIPHRNGTVFDVTPPSTEDLAKHKRHLAGRKAAQTRKQNKKTTIAVQ